MSNFNSLYNLMLKKYSFLFLLVLVTTVLAYSLNYKKEVYQPSADAEAFTDTFTNPLTASVQIKKDSITTHKTKTKVEKLIGFAYEFLGMPYYYTGKTPQTGFDCSGFTSYIYKKFGYEVSPASKEQIYAGSPIEKKEAKKGDLLVFTGTNLSIRKPGHVGIVISEKGESPIRFIHSSSNGGVKISEVENTRYELRLLQVRRIVN